MPTQKPRIIITVEKELLSEINEYWYNHRCMSRAQAVVDLVKAGLELEKSKKQK